MKPQYWALAEVRSAEALHMKLQRFIAEVEFDTYSMSAIVDVGETHPRAIAADNTPAAYRAVFEDPQAGRADPVAQFCKHRCEPVAWNQSTYTQSGQGERWEHQAQFGYKTGIAIALHLSAGRHLYFGVDREKDLPQGPDLLMQKLAALTLFAVVAQESAFEVLSPCLAIPVERLPPTKRELEALHWTMEGKTAWEVGRILAISEQTAARHLNSVAHKLGCVNKHHAVVKALRLGLLR